MPTLQAALHRTSDDTYEVECPDCSYNNTLDFIHEQGYCRRCKATLELTH